MNLYDEAIRALDEEEPQQAAKPGLFEEALSALDTRQSARTSALKTATIEAQGTTPDRAAEVRRLSSLTGLSAPLVERRFDELSKRVAVEGKPYVEMMTETPALAEWASDPSNAAVAADDMEQLGLLEWIVSAPSMAFAQSVHQMRAAGLRTKQLLTGSLTQEERDQLNSEKYASEHGGLLGAGDAWFRGASTGGAKLLANVLAATYKAGPRALLGAGVGAVIGGSAGFLAGGVGAVPGAIAGAKFGATAGAGIGAAEFGFELEAGLAYDEFLTFKDEMGRTIDPDAAKAAAFAAGALNAGLEVVGLGILARSIPGLKQLKGAVARDVIKAALRNPTTRAALAGAVKEYGGVLTKETAVEVAQRAVTIMSGEFAKSADPAIERKGGWEIAEDLAQEGAAAAQGFLLVAAPGPTLSLARNTHRANQADSNAAIFQALAEGAKQSKTIERAPDAARAFISAATKDGPVENIYIPTDSFTNYWQAQELDPRKVAAELTGDATAYDTAVNTGEDLKIPTADYAVKVAGTEHHAKLAPELRFGPDQMNQREATEFREQLQKEQEARAAVEGDTQAETPAQAVRRQVVEQLVGAGIPRATADSYASTFEALFGTMAARHGVDPAEFYARYGLKVTRPDIQAAPAANAAQTRPSAASEPAGEATAAPVAPPEGRAPEGLGGAPGGHEFATGEGTYTGPDRRAAAGAAPDGVERRVARADESLNVMSDIAGASKRMMEENPNLLRDAAALRERAHASRAPAPPRSPADETSGQDDKTTLFQEDTQPTARFDLAPARYTNGRLLVSTRVPSGRKAAVQAEPLQTDLAAILAAGPQHVEKVADIVRSYAQLTKAQQKLEPEALLEVFVKRVQQNLRFLWDSFDPELRDRAKLWYVGAKRISMEIADRYGFTDEQGAGLLAVLSPQKDWYQNVNLAERIAEHYTRLSSENTVFDKTLFDAHAARVRASWDVALAKIAKRDGAAAAANHRRGLDRGLLQDRREYEGKAWNELPLSGKAVLLRAVDETTDRSYPIITPEGGRGDVARNKNSEPSNVGWGSFSTIANGISILENGDPANIHARLGREHKVRSFFNNISDPDSPFSVTMDTHAIAAALLEPLSGNSDQVVAVMSGPGHADTGLSGINGLYAEAYFRLAEELSQETGRTVLAREAQSVTWEAIRLLFKPEQKRSNLTGQVRALWSRYNAGEVSYAETRKRIVKLAGGIGLPSWGDQAAGLAGDEGQLSAGDVRDVVQRDRVSVGRGDTGATAAPPRRNAGLPDGPVAVERPLRSEPAQDRGLIDGLLPDKAGQTTLYQSEPLGPVFFSVLAHVAERKLPKRGTAEQILATFKNPQSGVKAEELRWSGLEDWLDAQTGLISKDAVIEFLEANKIVIHEVMARDRAPGYAGSDLFDASEVFRSHVRQFGPFEDIGPAEEYIREALSIPPDQSQREDFLERLEDDRERNLLVQAWIQIDEATSPSRAQRAFYEHARQAHSYGAEPGEVDFEQAELLAGELLQTPPHVREQTLRAIIKDPVEVELLRAAWAEIDQRPPEQAQWLPTKFGRYTLPGGENYTELLLQLPVSKAGRPQPLTALPDSLKVVESDNPTHGYRNWMVVPTDWTSPRGHREETRAELANRFGRHGSREEAIARALETINFNAIAEWERSQPIFRTSHWDVDNVIAHIRFNDRTEPGTGQRVLFIEEIQSDWHQAGRRLGYNTPLSPEARKEIRTMLEAATQAHRETADRLSDAKKAAREGWAAPNRDRLRFEAGLAEDANAVAYSRMQELQARLNPPRGGVTDAPFKTTWPELAFKRMLRYAAENGYDKVAWTPGDIQNRRYDLSKQVRSIDYVAEGGGYRLGIVGLDGEGIPLPQEHYKAEELEGVVGKEIAEKIINGEGAPGGGRKTLTGIDLKVGGEGMKGFYDKILPTFANKYLKKWGVKVGQTEVPAKNLSIVQDADGSVIAEGVWYVLDGTTNAPYQDPAMHSGYAQFDSREEAERWLEGVEDKTVAAHSVEITDAMRESVLTQGQTLFAPNRRGSISWGADRQMTIALLANADLSTVFHETGHFFLEVMLDLEAMGVGQQHADDMKILRAWFGSETIGVEQHEQFARGFEAYLMEGKAPSVELRAIFNKFRAWLLGVYRSILRLNVTLTPEVRGVFDRMLATDEAIAQAQATATLEPMFATAEDAGMTPAEFALYSSTVEQASIRARETLEREMLAEVQREQTAEWKERRAAIEGKVIGEFHEMPVYQVLAAMQRGTTPAGEPLVADEDPEPLKLSRKLLVERYGKDRLKTLPRPYIYSTAGGLDPDIVAERYGFSSGDEMLSAVTAAPPLRQAIQQETDRRMILEHGSLLLDGERLEAAAESALGNDGREEVVRQELRALAKKQREVAPFVRHEREQGKAAVRTERAKTDAVTQELRAVNARARGGAAYIRAAIPPDTILREVARARVAGIQLRNLTPALFWHASRQAARKAISLAARQDLDGAVVAKQQELLNLALFRESTKVLKDADTRVRRAKALGTPAARARLGLAGEAYLDQVDGILDRYEFANVSRKVLDRRASLRKFVASLEAQGIPVDLAEELLEETRRVNYRELTIEELVGVTDGLDQILHLARLKTRLLKNKDQRDLQQTADTLVESIREHGRGRAPQNIAGDRRPSEERRRTIGDFFAGHRKLASMLRELDGFKDGGPAWDAIMRPLNDAGSREAEMNADATRRFAGIIERAFPGAEKRRLYTKMYVPAVGMSLSRMQRIMLAANWGNDGNRDRVRRAYNWTDDQVRAILDTLTPSELAFVQDIFDFIDSFWPEIEAKQKRVYGLAPEKVTATEITAASGKIRGGYFPLKYDDRLSASAIAALDLESANLAKQAAYAQASTKRGHTKERQQRVKIPVRLDFGVMFEHVGQVIHDLSHHEALIDVGRILGHRDVQEAIIETHGDLVYKQIRNTIRDVAFGDVPAVTGFERAINHVRMGATVAGLGWNLMTSLLQPIGLTNAMVRIGPKWVAIGVARWMRSPRTMVETPAWIAEKSAFMRARSRTMQREINEIRNQVGIETGSMKGWVDEVLQRTTFDYVTRQGVADSYFWMIQQAQRLADIPTWLGAYEKAMANQETEARAIALADQAVLDSQGGGQIKDLAQVQRGNPMMKLWTNFYSYFNVVYNQSVEARRRANLRNPVEVGRLASDYFMLYIAPATLGYMLRAAVRGDEEDDDTLVERLILENLSYIAGTMLFVRETAGVLSGMYGYEGPAGARAFATLGRLGQQARQGELDQAFWKSLNETAGVILHYPAGQASRTANGIAALVEGKTSNPLAVLTGPPREAR